ncbi:hypothetical protein [Streptomyces olivaceoviridis]|uniref:hypothetical protein n=1 Tax=Streptomyces olivaceoviridis TaxID=1921 RepID=UPI0036FCD900
MSQWNLSVRLTGQGSDLSRTLRSTARDAQAASRDINALRRDLSRLRSEAARDIRVRVDVDAAHLRSDVRAALTTAGAGQGLRVRLNLDADHLRSEVNAALATAGAGQGLGVRLRLTDAAQLRREVENAVRWAAWGHRIEIPIRLADPMQLRRDVSNAVRWASMNQTITVRVNPDTSGLNTLTRTLRNAGGGAGGGANFGLRGLLTFLPAAIPLAAGLGAELAPLAAQFTAAGVAGAAFGIAVAGQIGPLSDAADAEQKYQDAVVQHGANSKEAMQAALAYQQQLAKLPPASQKAAIALSGLKTDFSAWSDDMAAFTMEPVTHGIAILDQIIPKLTPEVKSASTQLDRLVTVAGGAIATPGFDALSDKIASFTDGKLDELTDQVIHLIRVLSQGGADHGFIAAFVDFARANGPEAREAVKAVAQAVIVLMQGASQAGPSLLMLATTAARLVAALPPELVGIILHVAAALKLLQLSGAGFAALAGGLTRVRTAILGLSAASTAAGGGLLGLRAAFLALGTAARASVIVAGVAAVALVLMELSNRGRQAPPDIDKLTTSLRELGQTGKVTGEAAKSFGKDLSGLYDRVRSLTDPSTTDKVQQFLVGWTGWDSTPVKDAKKNIDAIDKSLANLVKNGQGDLAADALKRLMAEYGKGGRDTSEITKRLDDYKAALADAKFEQELAAASMGVFGKAAQDTQAKLDAQKKSADGLRQSIQALNDVNRAAGGAMNAFEQAIDDAAEAAKKNSGALKMHNGELDLGSQKARDAESALRGLAANTDDAAAKAREQGKSWEYVQGIMDRGQQTFVDTAMKMGLTKSQAQALAKSYLDIPSSKTTTFKMQAEDAKRDLETFNAALKETPGAHSVTLTTLSTAAEQVLESFGYKVTRLPDGSVVITASAGGALSVIGNVQAAVNSLHGKDIGIGVYTTHYYKTVQQGGPQSGPQVPGMPKKDGGVVDFYANGGMRSGADPGDRPNQHLAQITAAGTYRVWGESETEGEGYVPFRRAARPRSRAITEEIVRRLGGDPRGIQWNADGSITDWRYDPQTGTLYSASDAGSAGHKTKKVKVKGKTKEIEYFDIGAVEKKLKAASKATTAWNKDLEKVADRVGGDVADALAGMGEDGVKLAHKMATGSTKYLNDMAAALRNLQKTAKASLTDYTRQLGKANSSSKAFQDDLAKLAAMGYGDLAAQLAAQGDEAAQQLADAATKDKSKAKKANDQAKTANNSLSNDQVAELVQIIAAISSSKTGIHDVAAKTQLGEDEIITVANKAKSQITKSLGSRAAKFMADLGRANKHLSYADGGIRAGLYATQNGIVRFAEPETHGEAYLPLSPSKRRSALPVLADVAHRFGLGLQDAGATRPVVIVKEGGDTHVQVTAVRTGASASDIGAQVGRSVRRARRGGVASHAA